MEFTVDAARLSSALRTLVGLHKLDSGSPGTFGRWVEVTAPMDGGVVALSVDAPAGHARVLVDADLDAPGAVRVHCQRFADVAANLDGAVGISRLGKGSGADGLRVTCGSFSAQFADPTPDAVDGFNWEAAMVGSHEIGAAKEVAQALVSALASAASYRVGIERPEVAGVAIEGRAPGGLRFTATTGYALSTSVLETGECLAPGARIVLPAKAAKGTARLLRELDGNCKARILTNGEGTKALIVSATTDPKSERPALCLHLRLSDERQFVNSARIIEQPLHDAKTLTCGREDLLGALDTVHRIANGQAALVELDQTDAGDLCVSSGAGTGAADGAELSFGAIFGDDWPSKVRLSLPNTCLREQLRATPGEQVTLAFSAENDGLCQVTCKGAGVQHYFMRQA